MSSTETMEAEAKAPTAEAVADAPSEEPPIDPEALKIAGIAGSLLAVMDLNDTMVFPFLAEFFLERGVSQGAVGGVFASVSAGMLLFALLMPKIMPLIGGPSITLASGLGLFAIARFLAAALPIVGPGTPLLVSSMVVFFFTGCVYAFSEVGALTWVLYTSPKGSKVGAMAALMGARMMGSMLGTPVGGILFDLVGWPITNIIGGLLLVAPLAVFKEDVLKPVSGMTEGDEVDSGKKLWEMPKFVLTLLISLIGQCATYAPVPYMQPLFKHEYGTQKWLFGIIFAVVIFVCFGGGGAAVVPLEKNAGTLNTLRIGFGLMCGGFLLLGPSPLLWFLQDTGLWEGVVALGVLMMGNAFVIIVAPPFGLGVAVSYGMTEEEAAVKTASYAIILMALSQSMGPVPGSFLASVIGPKWASTLLGLAVAGLAALCIRAYEKLEGKASNELV